VRLVPTVSIAVLLLAGCAGIGVTEKSGSVGDVSGLSSPGPGNRLVGARVRVCTDHGQAIGTYDFSVETSAGKGRFQDTGSAQPGDNSDVDARFSWKVG
jgi:hypothetical protein